MTELFQSGDRIITTRQQLIGAIAHTKDHYIRETDNYLDAVGIRKENVCNEVVKKQYHSLVCDAAIEALQRELGTKTALQWVENRYQSAVFNDNNSAQYGAKTAKESVEELIYFYNRYTTDR